MSETTTQISNHTRRVYAFRKGEPNLMKVEFNGKKSLRFRYTVIEEDSIKPGPKSRSKTKLMSKSKSQSGSHKKQVAKVMRFQGTNEKEMQDAINLLK